MTIFAPLFSPITEGVSRQSGMPLAQVTARDLGDLNKGVFMAFLSVACQKRQSELLMRNHFYQVKTVFQ
jgi:hypothetical protein